MQKNYLLSITFAAKSQVLTRLMSLFYAQINKTCMFKNETEFIVQIKHVEIFKLIEQ